jgi:hypothetical protein
MSKTEFFLSVEADLRLRHVPFDQGELRAFVRDVWPLVEAGDTPERWAECFLVGAAGGVSREVKHPYFLPDRVQ